MGFFARYYHEQSIDNPSTYTPMITILIIAAVAKLVSELVIDARE